MALPSQPLSGADAKREDRKRRKAEGNVKKVQHDMTPWDAGLETAVRPRKGSIREGGGSRKDRVKRTRSSAVTSIATGPQPVDGTAMPAESGHNLSATDTAFRFEEVDAFTCGWQGC
jgi:hypothetical protein